MHFYFADIRPGDFSINDADSGDSAERSIKYRVA
jgi:hypothetical protein